MNPKGFAICCIFAGSALLLGCSAGSAADADDGGAGGGTHSGADASGGGRRDASGGGGGGGGSSSGDASSVVSDASTGDGGSSGGGGGEPKVSAGCGKASKLKNSQSAPNYNTITSGGQSRKYLLRLPANYDNNHPYRIVLGFHGATGKGSDVAPSYFGLFDLSNGSTIFAAPDAVGGIWSAQQDTTLVDDMLKELEADLCIDTTRVELEGFSQGGAMAFTLACARPGVFRAAVVHSGGGLAFPSTCQPIAYFSSLGQQEGGGAGQTMTSDSFARTNGCTVETLPKAPSGGHLCSDYKGCSAGHPVRWCPYDGGHTPSPNDSGKGSSWMPQEVWTFLSQF